MEDLTYSKLDLVGTLLDQQGEFQTNQQRFACNKINVTVLCKKGAAHQFCIVDQWKNRSVDDMLRLSYSLDNIEDTTNNDDLEVSQEDL